MGSVNIPAVNVVDIRRDKSDASLLDSINQSLNPKDGSPPSLTTLLLYDEKGLKTFEEITYLDEYYLTNAEIEALTRHADAIAAQTPSGAQIIELGSGNLRKVSILLESFEKAKKYVDYYALDLSYSELERTFSELDTSAYRHVSFNALHGTYDDGFAWLAKPENKVKTTCLMTLGSSIGNFSREDSVSFLASFKKVLGPQDLVIVGLDACQDQERVYAAYNDQDGVTERFYRNGLDHANKVLGRKLFKQDDWAVETIYDDQDHKHSASYVALNDVRAEGFSFRAGEKIVLEHAYKYSQEQADELWHRAGLIRRCSYGNSRQDYFLHLLSPSIVDLPQQPLIYALAPVPSSEDWQYLWGAWDTVTKAMVPRDELMNKPIKLRNNLIFYLGHIPAFTDIHYTRATGERPTEPAWYTTIFERGIDPDVDDPEKCHEHSEIPEEWPAYEEILEYETGVRARIAKSMASGMVASNRKLGKALWLAFEHAAMHLETFLYMLLQSQKTLPPPGLPIPDFEGQARVAEMSREVNGWHNIPAMRFKIGIDDSEDDMSSDQHFSWDNEQPVRNIDVAGFRSQSRCISNGEYANFLEKTANNRLPASWIGTTEYLAASETKNNDYLTKAASAEWTEDGVVASLAFLSGKFVRTVYGPVPLSYALDWPVMASYDELVGFAQWAGGRIPSFEEARSIYHYVESQKAAPVKVSNSLISAVNGHLCNNGVEETPPQTLSDHEAVGLGSQVPDPNNVFIDLTDHNVGFKAWHPTPVTGEGDRLRGQSDAGGLWEWTSTPLASHEGFKAMALYPGYTADFFDNKHNICLGGSWATIPRIAGRKTFVNWYQRNYPYTWATARLVRDLE